MRKMDKITKESSTICKDFNSCYTALLDRAKVIYTVCEKNKIDAALCVHNYELTA